MKYSFVIFDWDGTLVDSEARIITSMQAAGDDYGWQPRLTDAAVRNIIGLGLPEAIRQICPGIDESGVEQMRAGYTHHFLEQSTLEMPLFAGVEAGLQRLIAAGCTLAVATGKSRRGLNHVLVELGLAPYFNLTRCADETRSKPDPLMLHELLDETGFERQQAIMIGDTEYDLAMAQNADMDRLAVTYGAHHPDRLYGYKPVFVADHFDQLVDWLLDA